MSSDSGIDLTEYVTDGRPNVRRLAQLAAGTIIGAIGWGVVNVILALADIPITVLEWLGGFLGREYTLILSIVESLIRGSFVGAAESVRAAGIEGFVLAIVIVGAAGFAFSWVVSRV